MSTAIPRAELEAHYRELAQAYLASLPPEHFMEATPQATQREITVESFALLRLRRPDFHYFNELLVLYPFGGETRPVVPDNMVVLHDGPIRAEGSYDIAIQPVGPFLVVEYVSKSSERKDYDSSYRKYESELKVPYYLLFYPETQDLSLFRLMESGYATVKPNDADRVEIPELDLEVAILDGWARYWYKGELLPLPADLQRTIDRMTRELRESREETRRAKELARLADEKARQSDEKARLADEKTRQSEEKVRLADEKVRLAREKEADERRVKEKILAQLKALGIEPDI